MSVAIDTPSPLPRGFGLAAAALAPAAIGGILATQFAAVTPVAVTPAIVLGVIAATSPALYIALAATGEAPRVPAVARAIAIALAAFGIALGGFVLPATFISFTSISNVTSVVIATVALGGAAVLGMRRLARELVLESLSAWVVFAVWSIATLGIAGRLWWDLARELV
jgi:hypothetical protein